MIFAVIILLLVIIIIAIHYAFYKLELELLRIEKSIDDSKRNKY